MTTNISKSTVVKGTLSKSDRLTWADSAVTWASAIYRWAADGKIPANISKSSVTKSNTPKS